MRSAHDLLVERYLTGRMSTAEKAAFVERMKSDESLRRLVEADKIITTSMRKEIAMTPAGAMEPGAELMAALASTPPVVGATAAGSGIAAALFSGSSAKVLVTAIGMAGIAIGTFLVAPLVRHEEPATVPAPRVMETPPAESPAPPAPAEAERPEMESPRSAAEPSQSLRKPIPTAPPDGPTVMESNAAAGTTRRTNQGAQPEKSANASAEGRDLLEEQLSSDPVVFSSDTVRMQVKMIRRSK